MLPEQVPAPARQRQARRQQHVAHTAHATHVRRGSYIPVGHRARVRQAAARALAAHHAVCRAAHAGAHGGHQRARHARAAYQPPTHPQPARARHGRQLATRARADRQRAVSARIGHPAGAAAAAAAAAARAGARGAAVPSRAPRLMRALGDPHVWAAWPALALAQGGALRAFPMGLGSSWRRLLASSSRQPYSMPHIVPHVPVIPHGRQLSYHQEEGARRLWGAIGR